MAALIWAIACGSLVDASLLASNTLAMLSRADASSLPSSAFIVLASAVTMLMLADASPSAISACMLLRISDLFAAVRTTAPTKTTASAVDTAPYTSEIVHLTLQLPSDGFQTADSLMLVLPREISPAVLSRGRAVKKYLSGRSSGSSSAHEAAFSVMTVVRASAGAVYLSSKVPPKGAL